VRKKLYRTLTALLFAALVVCAVVIIRNTLDSRAGEQSYEMAAQVAGLASPPASRPSGSTGGAGGAEESNGPAETEEDHLAALAGVNLAALREVNPEVVGWLDIPGTNISYPLLQGENNDYYLKHTGEGESSSAGSIFMECTNPPDFSNFNTILYGHKLRSGAMFAPLRFYEDDAYRQEHPSVYIADDAGLHRYDIFAVYAADVKDRVYQELDVEDEETRQAFIRFCLDSALADTGVTPEAGDRILTLSTCTGDGYAQRWVVQAVLRPEEAEGPAEGGGGG